MSKSRGRPFEPSNKFGRGRPRGSRNKAATQAQELLSEYALPITKKCIAGAMKGESLPMKICMDRILPALRESFVDTKLPRVRTQEDLPRATEQIVKAIEQGELTPAEGESIANILVTLAQRLPPTETLRPKAILPEFLKQALLAAQHDGPNPLPPNTDTSSETERRSLPPSEPPRKC